MHSKLPSTTRKNLQVRISRELADQIAIIASRERRSLAFVVERALTREAEIWRDANRQKLRAP